MFRGRLWHSLFPQVVLSRGSCDARTDADLVQAARREGGASAFDELVRRHHPRLVAVLTPIVGPMAEDVAQESFVRAYLALGRYEERSGFWAWLRVIAIRLARNGLRDAETRRRYQELAASSAISEPSAALRPEILDDRRRLLGGLAQLEYGEREVLVLHYLEGLSVREVANVTGASPSAVKMRLLRARARLKEKLSP